MQKQPFPMEIDVDVLRQMCSWIARHRFNMGKRRFEKVWADFFSSCSQLSLTAECRSLTKPRNASSMLCAT